MHSEILHYVMTFIFDWLIFYDYQWDNHVFTIWNIFEFTIISIVVITFLGGIVGFWLKKNRWRD